jgi:hypothetical protein
VLHNVQTQKNFRGERNFGAAAKKFQRRENFRAAENPKNFQTESFVCFRRKSQRANSKEIRESREKREQREE